MTEYGSPVDKFLGDACQFVERAFRYRKPARCGANAAAHKIADLGHLFVGAGAGREPQG